MGFPAPCDAHPASIRAITAAAVVQTSAGNQARLGRRWLRETRNPAAAEQPTERAPRTTKGDGLPHGYLRIRASFWGVWAVVRIGHASRGNRSNQVHPPDRRRTVSDCEPDRVGPAVSHTYPWNLRRRAGYPCAHDRTERRRADSGVDFRGNACTGVFRNLAAGGPGERRAGSGGGGVDAAAQGR